MKEVENIIKILKNTKRLIKEDNPAELKLISDQTIHSATISQDPDNVIIAVLVYSLGKIFERKYYRRMDGWNEFYSIIIKNLDLTIKALERQDIKKARTHLGKIRNYLNKLSGNLKEYIKDVFKKAEINKAFKIYEHGLSSEQTAELLGISLWDLSSYIGGSKIGNAKIARGISVRERIKITEDIFR
jgi:methyl-accepting chemotaxis protein